MLRLRPSARSARGGAGIAGAYETVALNWWDLGLHEVTLDEEFYKERARHIESLPTRQSIHLEASAGLGGELRLYGEAIS